MDFLHFPIKLNDMFPQSKVVYRFFQIWQNLASLDQHIEFYRPIRFLYFCQIHVCLSCLGRHFEKDNLEIFLLTWWRLFFQIKLMAFCSILLKYSVFGEGRVCNT